jgi:hypothetical protein
MNDWTQLAPGERRKVFKRSFSSVPLDYVFEARALNEGEEPEGIVEVKGSAWIFPKTPERQPLQGKNTVHAGFWDTFFSVTVTATNAIEVSVPARRLSSMRWVIWLALAVVTVACVPFLFKCGGG